MTQNPFQRRGYLALATIVVVLSAPVGVWAQVSAPDSFVDQLGAIDVGQSVVNDPNPTPALPPIAPIPGPVTASRITAQIELDGPVGLESGPLSAVASNWDFRWGVLNVGTGFLANAGSDWFFSNVANEGITGISIADGPGSYFLNYEVDLESQNLSLDPGNDYIIFVAVGAETLLANFIAGPVVPGGAAAQSDVVAVATDIRPFQFSAPSPTNFGIGLVQQLVTSRIIPVVPEPTTLGLLAVGATLALRRRRPLNP
ncbi:MAG: PEP-CTERM sorting domain-containing protein [Phycisphaerae bacterium]